MKLSIVRLSIVALVAGLLAGAGSQVALAYSTATTEQTMGTNISGYCYKGKSYARSDPGATASSFVYTGGCGGSTSAPTGWVGTQSILYGPGGITCFNIGPSYSTYATTVWSIGQQKNCGSGNYQSKSGTWMYQSNLGYYTLNYTTLTPVATH